jgi:subtilisin
VLLEAYDQGMLLWFGQTDASGTLSSASPPPSRPVTLVVRCTTSTHGAWGLTLPDFDFQTQRQIQLAPLDPSALASYDVLQELHERGQPQDGLGVVVGLLDAGISPHPDLAHTVVRPQDPVDVLGHGTHVAGIIGARGPLPGLAPGVTLRSYNVFPYAQKPSDFNLAATLDQAIDEGCHILNLSLGSPSEPSSHPLTSEALSKAQERGVLVFASNGNFEDRPPRLPASNQDRQRPVHFPANHPSCVAVASMGVRGTFPSNASQSFYIGPARGHDPHHFIPSNTSTGPASSLVGPGVAVVSTLSFASYGVSDGTSMACPAVVGVFARHLGAAQSVPILNMAPNLDRWCAMLELLQRLAQDLGFPVELQGAGLLPNVQRGLP